MVFTQKQIEAERDEYDAEAKRLMDDESLDGKQVAIGYFPHKSGQERYDELKNDQEKDEFAKMFDDPGILGKINRAVSADKGAKILKDYRDRQNLNKLKASGGER